MMEKFKGTADVYDSEIYVDSVNGSGFGAVINKLDTLIHNLSKRYYSVESSYEDMRQNVVMHILENIPKYNPKKGIKLSTFLHFSVERNLINDLHNRMKYSKSAGFLNVDTYKVHCKKCNSKSISSVTKGEKVSCPICGSIVEGKMRRIIQRELCESDLDAYGVSLDDAVDSNSIFGRNDNVEDDMIMKYDMGRLLNGEDKKLNKIVELVYFKGYPISTASNKVGLSRMGGFVKLKKLKKNKMVRDIFGR